MANITVLSRLVNGVQRQVNLSQNVIEVGGLQLDGSSSGNLNMIAAAATTSYTITWPAAVAGATGYVLSSDTSGVLSWVAQSGGANTSLSNLGTTSINANLIPANSTSLTLGTSSNYWFASWIRELIYPSFLDIRLDQEKIYNHTGSISIDVGNTQLNDNSGGTSVDWTNRLLSDATNTQFSWSTSGVKFNQLTASTVPYLGSGSILTSSAVTPTELGYLSGVTSAIQTQLAGKLSLTGGTLSGALNLGNNQINDVADPTNPQDAATKNYVDNAINGLFWKGPAEAYANANTALTGASTLTIDSYPVQNGDNVILANQTTSTQNGVYVASGIGTAYVLTPVTGSEAPTAIGDAYFILNGTAFGKSAFVVTQTSPNVVFTQFAGPGEYSFTAPLALSGNTVSLTLESSDPTLEVTVGQLAVKYSSGSGLTQGSGGLAVNPDGSTIDINGSSQLEVKAAGIGTTQLAAAAVTAGKLGTVTDGVTLDQSGASSTLEIKAAGVSATQLATGAFDQVTIAGGAGTPANVVYAPSVQWTGIAGQTFAANTTYALRFGLPSNSSETAGRLYAADITTTSFDLFWVVGFLASGAGFVAGNTITVVQEGSLTLGSSDTNFGSTDPGKPAYLQSGGINATTTPPSTTGQAVAAIGMVLSTTSFRVMLRAPYVY